DEVNGLIRGRLVVGMVTACTVTSLFDALAAFHLAHPGVEITLIEDNSDRLIAAVPPGHPLAGRSRATLADISAYPIVCMPEGTGVRTVFDQACAAKGIPPDIALQASAPGAVADLAIRGLGIAILSKSMAASHGGRLNALVIDDIQTPAVLALIWTAKKSPALRGLLPHSRQAFTSPQPGRALPAGGRAARQGTS